MDLSREIVFRWDAPAEPGHAALLKQAGITVVLTSKPEPAFDAACEREGIRTMRAAEVPGLKLDELGKAGAGDTVALSEGAWPGVSRGGAGGRDSEVASASSHLWVDANGYRAAYLRALYPKRPALLGYLPDAASGLPAGRGVPYDSLDLALIEAWAAGGNYILTVQKAYRESLLKGQERTVAAWRALGTTTRWLREHADLFARLPVPAITALVEEGVNTFEAANLLFRQNASPALARASDPPKPDPERRRVIVAASINAPATAVRNRILAHASAGAAVVVDGFDKPWWKVSELALQREEEDRWFYRLGAGTVVAYKEAMGDPGEFALDAIDLLTHKRRPVRLWNASAVIATALEGPRTLVAINYGSPRGFEIQARVLGVYSRARLLRPEAEPVELKAVRRGETTEVFLPEIRRLAVVEFG